MWVQFLTPHLLFLGAVCISWWGLQESTQELGREFRCAESSRLTIRPTNHFNKTNHFCVVSGELKQSCGTDSLFFLSVPNNVRAPLSTLAPQSQRTVFVPEKPETTKWVCGLAQTVMATGCIKLWHRTFQKGSEGMGGGVGHGEMYLKWLRLQGQTGARTGPSDRKNVITQRKNVDIRHTMHLRRRGNDEVMRGCVFKVITVVWQLWNRAVRLLWPWYVSVFLNCVLFWTNEGRQARLTAWLRPAVIVVSGKNWSLVVLRKGKICLLEQYVL